MDYESLRDLELKAIEEEKQARARSRKIKEEQGKQSDGMGGIEKFPSLTAEELMKLRIAQVSENKCAAYFGMDVDEFKDRVESDEDLKQIYETGPDRGKAMIQKTQFTVALAGDANSLKHFGEHHLNQKTKVTHEMDDKQIADWLAAAEAKLGQAQISDLRQKAKEMVQIEDAEYEEIDE